MIRVFRSLLKFLFGKKQQQVSLPATCNSISMSPVVEEKLNDPHVLMVNEDLVPTAKIVDKDVLEVQNLVPGINPETIELKLESQIPVYNPSMELKLGNLVPKVLEQELNINSEEKPRNTYYLKNIQKGSVKKFTNTFALAKFIGVRHKTVVSHIQDKYSEKNKNSDMNKIVFRQNYIITKERK